MPEVGSPGMQLLGPGPRPQHHSTECDTSIPTPLLRQFLWELKLESPGLSLQCKPGTALEKAGLS